MKLLIDMNLTPRWVNFLTAAGLHAVHWSSVGNPRAKDPEICEWAREQDFIIITNDLDFPQILAHTRDGSPSIVLLRGEPLLPEARGQILCSVLGQCEPQLKGGAIVVLNWDDGFRVRLLPLI